MNPHWPVSTTITHAARLGACVHLADASSGASRHSPPKTGTIVHSAGGGNRTHMGAASQRILSPSRLANFATPA